MKRRKSPAAREALSTELKTATDDQDQSRSTVEGSEDLASGGMSGVICRPPCGCSGDWGCDECVTQDHLRGLEPYPPCAQCGEPIDTSLSRPGPCRPKIAKPSRPAHSYSMLDWAVAYANHNRPVFPCDWRAGDHAKAPMVPPPGFRLATTDQAQIRDWWRKWPKALIGSPVPTDQACIDIDPRKGAEHRPAGRPLQVRPVPHHRGDQWAPGRWHTSVLEPSRDQGRGSPTAHRDQAAEETR